MLLTLQLEPNMLLTLQLEPNMLLTLQLEPNMLHLQAKPEQHALGAAAQDME